MTCEACGYWAPRTDTCDFILIRYRRRGCPPGEGCTHFSRRAMAVDAHRKAAAAPEEAATA